MKSNERIKCLVLNGNSFDNDDGINLLNDMLLYNATITEIRTSGKREKLSTITTLCKENELHPEKAKQRAEKNRSNKDN